MAIDSGLVISLAKLRPSDSPTTWKRAPRLGEDNEYVYLELLGFSETEFRSYVERGIIG